MRKIILLLLITFASLCDAQIFKQDFSASTTISNYINSAPDIGQFTAISASGTNFTASITNEALRFNRTGAGTMFAYRNFVFQKNPTFVQLQFDFEASNHELNKNNVFAIFIGSDFSDASAGSSSNYASRFGISTLGSQGEFKVSTIDNIGGAPSSSAFSGKQTITFIVNSTTENQTYTAPDGTTADVAFGKMDLWIGTTIGINDFSLKNTDAEKGIISGFKIQATSATGTGIFDFDTIEMTDLLGDSVPIGSTKSLIHPHIWVSNADKQSILNNINQYSWAASLFNQLKDRNSGRYNNHASNPNSEISLIPAIPGDRTIHRTRLNIGVECAILYYLTEDEKYAQIASDILHQYVKMISVKDPLTFEFYTTSFNHLIQTREHFPRVAMIYDFVQPFLSKTGTKVYDVNTNSQVAFNFDTAQMAFEVMANNVIKVGGNNSNHPVLELPGALYTVMCIDNDAKRQSFFNQLLNGAANSNQPGINWMLDRFSSEDRLWPESVGYGKFTHALFIQLMNIVDRFQPDLKIIEDNKDLLESIFIYENFLYPNGKTMAFGDIDRGFTDHAHIFRSILEIADRKGYADLKNRAASTLKKIYTSEGGYAPVIENQRLEWNNPLQLLWGVPIDDAVSANGETKYGTVKATHAGVVMQRNFSGVDDKQNGLMYYTGGGTYVHGHATGLDLEIYGAGYVIGPDYGSDDYGTDLHEQYAVSHAAHNTIIINGASQRGVPSSGTWENIVDQVVLKASEPKVYANNIAANFSFSTQYLDDTINDADQQRTNSIIRTSATTGYYVDVFRSKSNLTNNYHDYLFHGLGDVMQIKSGENLLNLTASPTRFQNDIGDSRKQPGWRWYSNAKTSALTTAAISARFDLQATSDFLHVKIPAGVEKEYSSALAPATKEVSNGYSNKDTQMFIMRKYGEAWNKPFIAIYEPSSNATSTVKSTENIIVDDKIVGVKVISVVNGQEIKDVILSNENASTALNLTDLNIAFTGRFAVVRTIVKATTTEVSLYLGDGEQLQFLDKTITGDSDGKAYAEHTLNYPLSTNDFNHLDKAITAYPNPSKGIVKITVPQNVNEVNAEVYNTHLQLVKSIKQKVTNGSIHVDISDTSKGVYFVKLNLDLPVILKIIKQ